MRPIVEALIEQALPAVAGFLIGVAAGIGLMWWVFL
jgi:hypothetical protein